MGIVEELARLRSGYRGPGGREKLRLMAEDYLRMTDGDLDLCWPWPNGKRTRYAQVMIDGHNIRAHRAMYEVMVGPIPDGLVLDHSCFNKCCVNYTHLEPVTTAVNNARAIAAGLRPTRYKRIRMVA